MGSQQKGDIREGEDSQTLAEMDINRTQKPSKWLISKQLLTGERTWESELHWFASRFRLSSPGERLSWDECLPLSGESCLFSLLGEPLDIPRIYYIAYLFCCRAAAGLTTANRCYPALVIACVKPFCSTPPCEPKQPGRDVGHHPGPPPLPSASPALVDTSLRWIILRVLTPRSAAGPRMIASDSWGISGGSRCQEPQLGPRKKKKNFHHSHKGWSWPFIRRKPYMPPPPRGTSAYKSRRGCHGVAAATDAMTKTFAASV